MPLYSVKRILFIIIVIIFFTSNIYTQSKYRLYIKDIVHGKKIKDETTQKIKEIITLSVFKYYKNKYRIINKEDICIIYKDAEELLNKDCNKTKCISKLGKLINADQVIYGKITKKRRKFFIKLWNIKRSLKTGKYRKKSFVKTSFYPVQLEWFSERIARKLINPRFRIRRALAKVKKPIKIRLKKIKLKRVRSISTKVYYYKSRNKTIAKLTRKLKPIIKKGDKYYWKKNYASALEQYKIVADSIKTNFTSAQRKVIWKFRTPVRNRIITSYAYYFKKKIIKADKIARAEKYDEALILYDDVDKEFNQIKPLYKRKLKYFKRIIKKRKAVIYKIHAKLSERWGDEFYMRYKFVEAKDLYKTSIEYINKLYNKKAYVNKQYKIKLKRKLETVKIVEYAYFNNIMQSECEQIDYYYNSDKKTRAKEKINILKQYIVDNSNLYDRKAKTLFLTRAKLSKDDTLLMLFEKTYGGEDDDRAHSIEQTKDGGFIIAGYTESKGEGDADFWILKLDKKGKKIWDRTYGGSYNDKAYSILELPDEGFIIAGVTESFGSGKSDMWVVRIDKNGKKIWDNTYGTIHNEAGYCVQNTRDGNFIISGRNHYVDIENAAEGGGLYIVKINKKGKEIWTRTYEGYQNIDDSNCILSLKKGCFVVIDCKITKKGQFSNFWILKLDEKGNMLWQKFSGGQGIDRALSVHTTPDGGFIIAGRGSDDTKRLGAFFEQMKKRDIKVLKMDKNGRIQWDVFYGDDKAESAYSVRSTAFNNYLIAGYTKSKGKGGSDGWLLKLDKNGKLLLDRTFGGEEDDVMNCIRPIKNGGYIVTGSTESKGKGDADFWLIKFFDFAD